MALAYIILLLLFSPFILGLLGVLYRSISDMLPNFVDEITKPEKGRYNVQTVNLLSYILDSKTYKFYLQMRLDGSVRYLMLGHLSESYDGLSALNFTYIIIPYNIDMRLKAKLKDSYSDNTIRGEKLKIVLKYLAGNFQIIKYKEYPKDLNYHYTFTLSDNVSGHYDDTYFDSIFDAVNNFENICRDTYLVGRSYRINYLEIVKAHNWQHSRITFPKSWYLQTDTREYRISYESLIDVLLR